MFRHRGKTRTLKHNLKIASLLSFIAGMVNVSGFLAVQRLTTNVTGHFAFFADEVFQLHFWRGVIYFLYIFFFFLGSFVSGLLIEAMARRNEKYIYFFPAVIECLILTTTGQFGAGIAVRAPDVIAFSLLFAMGLQNALVTNISNAAVRTTHLTGLFTDLGIELAQFFFYKRTGQQQILLSSIRLRLTIISFFFLGGIGGGFAYTILGLPAFTVAGFILTAGVLYDYFRFRVLLLKRKFRSNDIANTERR